MGSLDSKVAIVTGASRGIGAGIAKAFAGAGASVIINYAGNPQGAAATVAAITSAGGRAEAVSADVSKATDVARLIDDTERFFGRPDIVVNNAGIYKVRAHLRPCPRRISADSSRSTSSAPCW